MYTVNTETPLYQFAQVHINQNLQNRQLQYAQSI